VAAPAALAALGFAFSAGLAAATCSSWSSTLSTGLHNLIQFRAFARPGPERGPPGPAHLARAEDRG